MKHREGQGEDDFSLPTDGGWDDLQPDDSDAAQLAEARREVDRLERRLADQELYDQMARDGFTGARYELWRDDVARYAIATGHAQMRSGQIFRFAVAKGRPVGGATTAIRQLLREDDEARSDLVTLLVVRTLKVFREAVLLPGTWSAAGGASLKTYFIGAMHGEFSELVKLSV